MLPQQLHNSLHAERGRGTGPQSAGGGRRRKVVDAMVSWNRSRYRSLQFAMDMLGLASAWYLTAEVLVRWAPVGYVRLTGAPPGSMVPPLGGILVIWLLAGAWMRFYDPKASARANVWCVVKSVCLAGILTVVVAFFSPHLAIPISRLFVMVFLPVIFVVLVGARVCTVALANWVEKLWPAPERVAVLGWPQNRAVEEVTGVIPGCVLHGAILSRKDNTADGGGRIPVLGNTTQLAEVINRERLDRILIMDERLDPEELRECARISRRMGIIMNRHIGITDPGFEVRFAMSADMPMLELKPVSFTRTVEMLKRVFDVIVAALCLILLSLPMLLIAILIKLSSSGPVLYRSPRVGRGGRHFMFYKFRSMYANPHSRKVVAALNEKGGHIFKVKQDPRVTGLGRILRRYSLDELPQFFNILRGDMSLVGPRPLPAGDLDPDGQSRQFATWAEQRSLVLPGLTGLWQVRGRSDLPFESMIELDLCYIRNWSLLLDLKILALTPFVALSGRGAY